MYGDRRPFALHYYLEDDTAELNEMHSRNTGRDPAPGFVKRAPLPKVRTRRALWVCVRACCAAGIYMRA